MKLAIAVIQDEFIARVTKALMVEKVRMTKLASTGGFLKHKSTTLVIGIDDDKVYDVIELIRRQCNSKKSHNGENQVIVSGANIFLINVDQYLRI